MDIVYRVIIYAQTRTRVDDVTPTTVKLFIIWGYGDAV
jgi:hypothetical protein